MHKQSYETLKGNDRYEGFVVDIIDELSKLLGFKYILRTVSDNNYGTFVSDLLMKESCHQILMLFLH